MKRFETEPSISLQLRGATTARPASLKVWLCALAVILEAACARAPARVPSILYTVGSLAVTNSPMLGSRREPRLVEGRLEFAYSFIVEGVGFDRIDIDLAGAKATAAQVLGHVQCSAHGHRGPMLSLGLGDRSRIDCRVTLAPETGDILRREDVDVVLTVPINQASGEATLRFGYQLRIEDAS